MTETGLAALDRTMAVTTALKPTPTESLPPWMSRIEGHPSWKILAEMKMTLRAEVSLRQFRVSDLLALAKDQVLQTDSPDTEDVPLKIAHVQLGWSEFEVVEQKMALRLTRLA